MVALIVSIEIDHLQRKTVEITIIEGEGGNREERGGVGVRGNVSLKISFYINFEFPHQVTILIRSGPIFYLQAVSCCEHPILVDESSATTDAWPDNNPQLFISFYCYLPNLTRNASWIPSP